MRTLLAMLDRLIVRRHCDDCERLEAENARLRQQVEAQLRLLTYERR